MGTDLLAYTEGHHLPDPGRRVRVEVGPPRRLHRTLILVYPRSKRSSDSAVSGASIFQMNGVILHGVDGDLKLAEWHLPPMKQRPADVFPESGTSVGLSNGVKGHGTC